MKIFFIFTFNIFYNRFFKIRNKMETDFFPSNQTVRKFAITTQIQNMVVA